MSEAEQAWRFCVEESSKKSQMLAKEDGLG